MYPTKESSPDNNKATNVLNTTLCSIFEDISNYYEFKDNLNTSDSKLNISNTESSAPKEDPGIILDVYPEEPVIVNNNDQTSFDNINEHELCVHSDSNVSLNGLFQQKSESQTAISSQCIQVSKGVKRKKQKRKTSITNKRIQLKSQESPGINSTFNITNCFENCTHYKEDDKSSNSSYITLNKNSLKKAIKLLSSCSTTSKKEKYQMTKFRRTCQEGYNHMFDLIHWQSYAYTVRVIRNLILNREWVHLKEMLRVMMKQKKIFKNYVKEMTYLYYLINADTIDPVEVDEYFQLCFSSWDKSKKPVHEFDIWYKISEN